MAKFSMPDKLKLAQLPTPIHRLAALSTLVSRHADVEIFVKRDDLTHGPAAGNKIRKLEFLLADALAKGRKAVFTCGAVQSNHARATALLCRQLGLECVLFLRGEAPASGAALEGNLLLDRLSGARIRYVTQEEYDRIETLFVEWGDEYRKRDGVVPYFIPEGGSNDTGALGYCAAFEEILGQAGSGGIPESFSSVVVANGSGGTHAGLLLGRDLAGERVKAGTYEVASFNVCRTAGEMAERVKRAALAAIQKHRMPISFMPSDVRIIDGYVGPGYGKASPEVYDFIVARAREDGITLDPVYTGKAMYGMVSELMASPDRARIFGNRILFIHTGGLPALFAHGAALTDAVARRDV